MKIILIKRMVLKKISSCQKLVIKSRSPQLLIIFLLVATTALVSHPAFMTHVGLTELSIALFFTALLILVNPLAEKKAISEEIRQPSKININKL